jgi:1-aminocyclopropane-1-carboxylate deaminase/D-cysteine desulfhydrase-like pyridoxal-dependent ACC family enzyme
VRLAKRAAGIIESTTGARVPAAALCFEISHDEYGGAYGRETNAGRNAATRLRAVSAVDLDATYSAKAFAHALELAARDSTLFWLTFDSRILAK